MSSIITPQWFTGTLFIPNVNTILGNGGAPVSHNLQGYIDKYESEIMVELFGYSMYQSILNVIQGNSTNPCIKSLIDGEPFTDSCGRDNYWMGLAKTIAQCDGQPLSIIANYVYFMYQTYHVTTTMQGGETKPKHDNSDSDNMNLKLHDVWNEMIDWIAILADYVKSKPTCFPLFEGFKACKTKYQKLNRWGI